MKYICYFDGKKHKMAFNGVAVSCHEYVPARTTFKLVNESGAILSNRTVTAIINGVTSSITTNGNGEWQTATFDYGTNITVEFKIITNEGQSTESRLSTIKISTKAKNNQVTATLITQYWLSVNRFRKNDNYQTVTTYIGNDTINGDIAKIWANKAETIRVVLVTKGYGSYQVQTPSYVVVNGTNTNKTDHTFTLSQHTAVTATTAIWWDNSN